MLPFRVPPFLDPDNTFYWTGGGDGRLRIQHCRTCSNWIHPVAPRCRRCGGADLEPRVVSGRGRVATYTVNHQPWIPGAEPYLIALVELEEQAHLYLLTNLVDVDGDDVRVGMPVEVVFEQSDHIYYPLFRPSGPT